MIAPDHWQVFGASVRGTSHVHVGLPCQDAHGWRLMPGGVACAVADGLGSAALAEAGAARAVAAALDALTAHGSTGQDADGDDAAVALAGALRDAMTAARDALFALASDAEHPPRDYATTLLLAAATRDWTAVAQIGDGAIVGCWPDGRLETLSPPQRGEYANEVTPLTADDAMVHLYVRVWPNPVQALVLFTDGLQSLTMNLATATPFAPFYTPFLAAVAAPLDADATAALLADFLASPRVCARTDDDKTLLVAGRTAA